ncbi:hypothetical protein EZS27_010038 [termite gut metagenome]|uniref:Uncharacterized protein n=1 Tax=termite gut metagenome TaxID=433724 RepID=A0A5J4S7U5_9ZZZZ
MKTNTLKTRTVSKPQQRRSLFKDSDTPFVFIPFCTSPTEKRAEHIIRHLKYGTAKDTGHTRVRWYAWHEAYKNVRNEKKNDFVEPNKQ